MKRGYEDFVTLFFNLSLKLRSRSNLCYPKGTYPTREGGTDALSDITRLITEYGYVGLYAMLLLEYLILIVPGETTLTTAGALWRSGADHLQLPWMIVATTLGTFSGAMIAYVIGRTLGRSVILRYGKYVFLTPERLEQSEILFEKYTILTLIVSRYIPVARDIVPYIAGIQKVRLRVFIPIILVMSAVWTTTFLAAGGALAALVGIVIRNWRTDLIPAIAIAAILIVAYVYFHRKMSHSMKNLSRQKKEDKDVQPTDKPGM